MSWADFDVIYQHLTEPVLVSILMDLTWCMQGYTKTITPKARILDLHHSDEASVGVAVFAKDSHNDGKVQVCAVGASITCSTACQSNSLARALTMCASESGHSACSHKSSYWQPGIFGNKEIDATLRVRSLLFRTGSGCSKVIWGFSCIGLSLTSLFFRFTYYLHVCFVIVSLLF